MKRMLVCMAGCLFLFSCSLIKIEPDSVASRRSANGTKPEGQWDISGDITIANIWGQRFSPPERYARSLYNLKTQVEKRTNLNVTIRDHVYLDSPHLLDMPFVYITTENAFDLTEQEIANLNRYLSSGGFLLLDNALAGQENSRVEASYRKMMRDTLSSSGEFLQIRNSHEIYKCFYELDGPPIGVEIKNSVDKLQRADVNPARPISDPVRFLEGITIGDRLAVILSNKGYVVSWLDISGNDPQFKMGVNMIIYAITHPDGLFFKQ